MRKQKKIEIKCKQNHTTIECNCRMTAASMCTAHCAATPDKNMEGALTLRLIAEYITLSNSTDLP